MSTAQVNSCILGFVFYSEIYNAKLVDTKVYSMVVKRNVVFSK